MQEIEKTKPWAAVLGSPITHSLSPLLHDAAYRDLGLDLSYGKYEVSESDIKAFLENVGDNCRGLSLTMPLKQAVIPYLDQLDGMAKVTGVVNTVVFAGGSIKAGFNTDVHGIIAALRETNPHGLVANGEPKPFSAVVLGSGATACSAIAALAHLRIGKISVVARSAKKPGNALQKAPKMGVYPTFVPMKREDLVLSVINSADIVISTLPVGVFDELAQGLQPRSEQLLLDVVYNPWPSALVSRFQTANALVAPGWLMLLHQAVMQVSLFTSRMPDIEVMKQALLAQFEPDV